MIRVFRSCHQRPCYIVKQFAIDHETIIRLGGVKRNLLLLHCFFKTIFFSPGRTSANRCLTIMRRKLYIGVLLGAIFFLMIAVHCMQKTTIILFTLSTSRIQVKNQTLPVLESTQVQLCSCKSCIADKGSSEWFAQHFDHQQQPYFTGSEKDIDPVSLKWWLVSLSH